eukprot:5345120-Amphidinium_carterae.1
MWKNAAMYMYAIYLSTTDYFLHFDSDVEFQSSSSPTPWLTAAASYLSNSTALTGLWSLGFEACHESLWRKG